MLLRVAQAVDALEHNILAAELVPRLPVLFENTFRALCFEASVRQDLNLGKFLKALMMHVRPGTAAEHLSPFVLFRFPRCDFDVQEVLTPVATQAYVTWSETLLGHLHSQANYLALLTIHLPRAVQAASEGRVRS